MILLENKKLIEYMTGTASHLCHFPCHAMAEVGRLTKRRGAVTTRRSPVQNCRPSIATRSTSIGRSGDLQGDLWRSVEGKDGSVVQ